MNYDHATRTTGVWVSAYRGAARRAFGIAMCLFVAALLGPLAHADEPYAPTREYELQNARIELRFDVDQRKSSAR